ncbi:hypothetical protein [Synechococcus sp. PCC 7502]|uniref:hypothetical protein n=1 Tax=Synechococcus sp. PCC 7502 TaxID=1173263 RepID=UPI0002F84DB8|nr:hypothetical protein [Synechococcus sp. PCC 7502]
MSSKDYWQRVLVGVAIVVMAGVAIAPMVFKGYPITHSTQFNLSWVFQYQRQFLGGQFYPRWLEFSNFGFGNATFVFYPPMLMVATLPFCIFGDVEFSLIASMGLAALVLAVGLYKYARLYFPRWLSVAIALLGVGSPYFLIDVYQRGAMAEVWAVVWIPWVFFTTQKLIDTLKFDSPKFADPKSINAISLGNAGVIPLADPIDNIFGLDSNACDFSTQGFRGKSNY